MSAEAPQQAAAALRFQRVTKWYGTIVALLAFVTVQAGGCGFKTPLQVVPKKATPAKPAS